MAFCFTTMKHFVPNARTVLHKLSYYVWSEIPAMDWLTTQGASQTLA